MVKLSSQAYLPLSSLSAPGTVKYLLSGGLNREGLHKFLSSERGTNWRGALIQRWFKKTNYGIFRRVAKVF